MKHIFAFVALACIFSLDGYDAVFQENPLEPLKLEVFSNPYDGNTKQQSVNTSFGMAFNESIVMIEIELEKPHASDTLEIFLKTAKDNTKTRYYQFYGSPQKNDIALYYYGQENFRYQPLANDESTISISSGVKNGAATTVIRIAMQWSAFRTSLPFMEDDAAPWLFNIVRWRDGKGYTLKGKLHEPSTWDTIKMPVFTEAQKGAILESVARRLEMRAPQFNAERFDKGSFLAYKPAVASKSTPLERFLAARDAAIPRIELGASSFTVVDGKHAAKYIFREVPQNRKLWLVNASTLKQEFNYSLTLDGVKIKDGTRKDFPFNLDLSAYAVKPGSVLEMKTDAPEKTWCKVSFGIAAMKHGVKPATAFDVRYPAPAEAAPKRDMAGVCDTNYLSRHLAQQRDILRKNARVVFIGDSITDGFHGAEWDELDKRFNCGNMGISGDWTQNVLWRIDEKNGCVLSTVRPDVCVLMIGTNNNAYTPEETANGIAEIITRLKKQLPETKIILFNILPRNAVFEKGNRYEQINNIISRFGDGKTVFNMDMGSLFMDEERKVDKALLPDLLHPNAKGYSIWVKYITPALEKLTEKE